MPIQREFLDWSQPALPAAAQWLHARFAQAGQLDLSQVIVVVPGSRAGRRLLEILVELSEENEVVLVPPTIVTEHALPELLYEPQLQFADPLTQQLAWVSALRSLTPERLAPFLPHPPAEDDIPRWLAIANSLRSLHTELAADGLHCSDVARGAAAVDGFAEHDRWHVLCELQSAYLRTLDGLKLWDVQTARLVAIEKREIATDQQIVLLGMADLNRAQRRMLDQIADKVTALVVAPRALAERFDEHGCVVPDAWTTAELPLADEQIERVDGPGDQAEAVTRWLAALEGRYRADEIVVGLPDERLAPQIERQIEQSGLAARFAIGKQLAETGPYRLLKVAADYAARRRFRDLAALVRHPDVFDWLSGNLSAAVRQQAGDILTALDTFASRAFPARLDDRRLEKDDAAADVRAIAAALDQLIEPLSEQQRPLGEWAASLRGILMAIYGQRQLDRACVADRYVLAALRELATAIDRLAGVPSELAPSVDARQACRLMLEGLAAEGIAPPANPAAIELLGWLELPLDDAPVLLITGFNEGFVPKSTSGECFLPNRLRQSLGVLHNDRRLARDAYALSVLLASRKELRLLVPERDAEGNPLTPSRLLFATGGDRIVARAQRFFGDFPPTPPRRNLLVPQGGALRQSKLAPHRPLPRKEPLAELSVTKFRDYIACPYRFYLRHVLNLQAIADEAAELDGGAFGDLVHLVLEHFGRDPAAADARVSADPSQIVEYLDYQLGRVTAARYGKHVRPAVRVQVEQVKLRLKAFAEWQAGRARDGWRIVFSEDSEERRSLTAPFVVDGQPFTLRGRIDRIDYHEGLARLSVLDYKTADSGNGPERTHRKRDEWVDLQLPLYRHLLKAAKLTAKVPSDLPIEMGYVVLPRDLTAAGLALAEWDSQTLEGADERARQIVRAIRAEVFWPPTSPPPEFADDVAVLCHDHRLGSYRAGSSGLGEGDAA